MNGEEKHGRLNLLIKKFAPLQFLQEALCRGTKTKCKSHLQALKMKYPSHVH